MKLAHMAGALLVALGGLFMLAQDGRIVAAEDGSRVLDSYFLKGDRIQVSHAVKKDYEFLNYTYNGREYRRLSRADAARFDASKDVEAKRLGLYYRGRRVRTDVLWVTKVFSAFHWSGGVVVVAHTSRWHNLGQNDIGFIDPRTNTCRFTGFGHSPTRKTLDFLVPATMDSGGGRLALDVAMPERCHPREMFDVTVSLTNVSDVPIVVSDSLIEGLGLTYPDEKTGKKQNCHEMKYPDPSDMRGAGHSPLMPSERRETVVPLSRINDIESIYDRDRVSPEWATAFGGQGRRRMVFYWDGLLDPSDSGKITRLFCERVVDVVAQTIDTSRKDLALEVAVPERVPGLGKFDVRLSLANVSDRAILVPDNIADGLGEVRTVCFWRKPSGKKVRLKPRHKKSKGGEVVAYRENYSVKHPMLRIPYRDHCSPLLPGERREAVVSLSSWSVFPGLCHLEFYWDGLLDPDDRGHVSRFSTGKTVWVDVTK